MSDHLLNVAVRLPACDNLPAYLVNYSLPQTEPTLATDKYEAFKLKITERGTP